jgi:uncharacterized membrane protein YdjX (TVP38/TMEM64 family)
MPPPSPASPPRKRLLPKLALAAVLLVSAGLVVLKEQHPLLAILGRVMAAVTRLGPWAFFAAMAILPALGVPSTLFTVTAGSAFSAQLGMTGVVAAGVAAMTINIALTYVLARWVLRAWLQRLLTRFGYRLPEVEKGDVTDLIIVLRVTAGIPLCVQNYLLGLANAPPARYFVLSYLIAWPTTAAYLLFGDALLHGKGKMILGALTMIVFLSVGTHFLRRHYASRKAAAA